MQAKFLALLAISLTACGHAQPLQLSNRLPGEVLLAGDRDLTNESAGPDVELTRPIHLLEVFANINAAFTQGLLLRDDFYTAQSLTLLSGGTNLSWIRNDPWARSVSITGFGGMIPPVRVGRLSFEGLHWSVALETSRDNKATVNGYISLMASHPEVSFRRIMKVFGSHYTNFPFFPPPRGKIFAPPTDPHGNDRIRYLIDADKYSGSIVIEFDANGALESAQFFQHAK